MNKILILMGFLMMTTGFAPAASSCPYEGNVKRVCAGDCGCRCYKKRYYPVTCGRIEKCYNSCCGCGCAKKCTVYKTTTCATCKPTTYRYTDCRRTTYTSYKPACVTCKPTCVNCEYQALFMY